MLSKIFTSIAFRISISIAFVVAATTMLVAWFILAEQKNVLESELQKKGLYLAKVISQQLVEPLLYEDRYSTYTILQSALVEEKGIVVFAEVFDTQGESIVNTDDSQQSNVLPKEYLNSSSPLVFELSDRLIYDILSPIQAKGLGSIGYLRIYVTKKFLIETINNTRKNLYVFSSLIVLSGIMAGLWMARKIIRPVLILNHGVNKLKSGELGVEVGIVGEGEIKELSIAFNEMSKRLKESTEEIKKAQDNLIQKEKLYALGEFSASLAHEIKNPLTSIKMLIQTAKNKDYTFTDKDISVIEDEINRIDRIVKEFLAFARPPKNDFRLINLKTVLNEVITLMKPIIDKSNIYLILDLDSISSLFINAHHDSIKQVFLNIFLNAIQAMPNGGNLEVKGHCDEDSRTITIEIIDTGIGISQENLTKVFDPFFTTKEEGTGMGLAIAYNIVKKHNGYIEIDSSESVGTTVKITLPY
ncbi:MAG: ATP-binding protein [Thermodesulfovibrionales bacterium]|nr:ATP-binding protein [Thermodesulfovibrionales bacterium]